MRLWGNRLITLSGYVSGHTLTFCLKIIVVSNIQDITNLMNVWHLSFIHVSLFPVRLSVYDGKSSLLMFAYCGSCICQIVTVFGQTCTYVRMIFVRVEKNSRINLLGQCFCIILHLRHSNCRASYDLDCHHQQQTINFNLLCAFLFSVVLQVLRMMPKRLSNFSLDQLLPFLEQGWCNMLINC